MDKQKDSLKPEVLKEQLKFLWTGKGNKNKYMHDVNVKNRTVGIVKSRNTQSKY